MINRKLIRLKIVQLVYAYYQNEGKTIPVAEKELDYSLTQAYKLYLYQLSFLVALRQLARQKNDAFQARLRRSGKADGSLSPQSRLAENALLEKLADNATVGAYIEKEKQPWPEEDGILLKVYESMAASPVTETYMAKGDFSFEADRELMRKLYKTCIAQNEDIDAMLEAHGLYWNDDKDVVDSFVLKTIKRTAAGDKPDQPLQPEYTDPEDKNFAHDLFVHTLTRAEETRRLIRENCKNWKFERMAAMDIVIAQIALTEILDFPQIPLNVTFNEYIEIAKAYSTPRSGSYLNGLLDNIVKQLRETGTLMKA